MSEIFYERRLQSLQQAHTAVQRQRDILRAALAELENAPISEMEREEQRRLLEGALDHAIEIRGSVEAEQARYSQLLDSDRSDETFLLALLAWLDGLSTPSGTQEVVATVQADPIVLAALQAGEAAPTLTEAAAAAVVQTGQGRRLTSEDLAQILNAAGPESAQNELVFAGHRRWLIMPREDRPYLYDDVAVLLPIRLETLFKERNGQWTMLLRIVPDEASIRRDNPTVTPFEIDGLMAMWQAVYDDLPEETRAQPVYTWLDSPRAKVEWSILCDRFGGSRAADLTAKYSPTVNDHRITVETPEVGQGKLPDNRVGGFPEKIEIWVDFGNGVEHLTTTPPIKTEALTFDVIGQRLTTDGETVIEEKERWWVSWEEAKDVGLGIEHPLPAGRTPDDIQALYAIGLGEENPEEHFRAQIDAGEMAILSPGAPTNAVDGKQAADLATSAEAWRIVAKKRLEQKLENFSSLDLGTFLAGMNARLPAVPEGDRLRDLDHVLVGALWPALWGHYARDLWGWGPEADRTGMWALSFLRPNGPLPAIRIDTQPYGLLPTTALSRWKVGLGESHLAQIEKRMKPSLLMMREYWANTARSRGNAFEADTTRLLDLISSDALSAGYGYRYFIPLPLWEFIYGSTTGVDPDQLNGLLDALFGPAYVIMQRGRNEFPEFRHHLSGGYFQDLTIPLVVPTQWPEWFYKQDRNGFILDEDDNRIPIMTVAQGFVYVLRAILEHGSRAHELLLEDLRGTLPDSLLIRLLIYANLISAAAVVQENQQPGPLLEPIVNHANETLVQRLANQYGTNLPHNQPAGETRTVVMNSLEIFIALFESVPESFLLVELERTLRATLDSAAHRIDPWITGMAYRRLSELAGRMEARFRLGVYGWVDGPIRGKLGPNEGGLLHAPSHSQALTGVILRDKFISEGKEIEGLAGARNVWDMQLESSQIRAAVEMADEARLGSHIFEVVGRQVERIIGSRANIETLRMAKPLKNGSPDRKRVCHGVEALPALLSDNPPVAVNAAQRAQLELLRKSIDAYGDLLVAEAVHHVVTGRAETAGAAMDAAAGLSQPPSLEFTQTPLSGYTVNTAVLTVLPFRAPASDPDPVNSPASIADGSVPAALETLLGSANQWVWSWQGEGEQRTITLQDCGLDPIDSVVFSVDLLNEIARVKLGVELGQPLEGSGPEKHRLAREIVAVLGNQAILVRDIVPVDEPESAINVTRAQDVAILNELRARYLVLRDSVQRLIDDLGNGIENNDTAALRRDLFRALRWGVRPVVERAEQQALFEALFNGTAPTDPTLLPRLASRAQQALQNRLKAAPVPTDKDNEQLISRSIAELATPEGQLAILSRIEADTLKAKSRLRTDAADAQLDDDWLPVVAAVRPALARLEALQLEAELNDVFIGFDRWSSAPEDHWQTRAVTKLEQRRQELGDHAALVLPRFVSAYSVGNVFEPGGENPILAVGLVDSWGEVIPRTRHTTTAAFGFNAPIARSPQAILLAVPPDLESAFGTPFDTSQLIQVLQETRELAHARAVRFEDLGVAVAAIPSMMFQANDPTGVRLHSSTKVMGL